MRKHRIQPNNWDEKLINTHILFINSFITISIQINNLALTNNYISTQIIIEHDDDDTDFGLTNIKFWITNNKYGK